MRPFVALEMFFFGKSSFAIRALLLSFIEP
jgi:hypothetical protein